MALPFSFLRPQSSPSDLPDNAAIGDADPGPGGQLTASPGALPLLRYGLLNDTSTAASPSASADDGNGIADPGPGIQLAAATDPLTGYATYYDLRGQKTATGQPFDPNSNNAAMYQPGVVHMGDRMRVQLQKDPNASVDVTVNDTGPFARGPDHKALLPLRPDPNIIIDLTPQAFEALTGNLKLGKVPVVVTPKTKGP